MEKKDERMIPFHFAELVRDMIEADTEYNHNPHDAQVYRNYFATRDAVDEELCKLGLYE